MVSDSPTSSSPSEPDGNGQGAAASRPDRKNAAGKPAAGNAPARRRRPLFMKQKVMLRMVYALAPLVVAAVYFFGWRVLAVLAVVHAFGLGTEWLMSRQRGQPISMACFVTCLLYGLSLPPTVPYWIAAVGIVVAVLFGKEVFGGFGRNFANPAIIGRAFVYVCFPVALQQRFVPVFKGLPAGFAEWSWTARAELPRYLSDELGADAAGRRPADAVSTATPLKVSRDYGFRSADPKQDRAPLLQMLLGSIGGTYRQKGRTEILSAGSMGEVSAALILLSAVYLLATRTANWRLMLSTVVGLAAATVVFRHLLGFAGRGEVPPLHFTLLAGTTIYVTVFMVTDPVSAPKRRAAMFAYGLLIGFLVVLLRWRGVFVAAASFSILLGNLVGPLLDIAADAWRSRGKARAEAAEGKTE